MSNSTNSVIEIKDLRRSYGKHDAVNGLSLSVRPGRCYGFFGRNGAGKTTTIKCLLNLLRPNSGSVSVFGLNPQRAEVAVKARAPFQAAPITMPIEASSSSACTMAYFAFLVSGSTRSFSQ